MAPHARAILALAQQEAGDRYVYGAEVDPHDPNPPGPFDCSELVQWACSIAGVSPTVPDGSAAQLAHCRTHGTLVPVSDGIWTPGALLFMQTSTERHVALSRGNGSTIEARGRAYGVGNFPASGRPWTHAARIPGVDYSPVPVSPPARILEEDDVLFIQVPGTQKTDPTYLVGAKVWKVIDTASWAALKAKYGEPVPQTAAQLAEYQK